MSNCHMTRGKVLRRLRIERGLTQSELAERLLEGASALITTHDAAGVFAAWSELQEGLKRFPANIRMLM